MSEKKGSTLRNLFLLLQILIFALLEKLVPQELLYLAAWGTKESPFVLPLYTLPLSLLVARFLPVNRAGYFFILLIFILPASLEIKLTLMAGSLYFYFLSRWLPQSRSLTFFLLFNVIAVGIFQFNLFYQSTASLHWLFMLLQMFWILKTIAWIVTVRIYKKDYVLNDYLDFFFNPAFFLFTNDLNVLTPDRFLSSRQIDQTFKESDFKKNLGYLVTGVFLIVVYGYLQKYYFLNLSNVGFVANPMIGGAISIIVAILFHAANVCLQVPLLNAYRNNLAVDMNKPWLAMTPSDYWQRMHFYVRDYILEIILKPILTTALRMNFSLKKIRLFFVFAIYMLFVTSQVGYQPFRANRSIVVGLLVCLIFIVMFAAPEWIGFFKKQQPSWKTKLFTFLCLYVGYCLIFLTRQGF